jgi:hypothetical protein
MCGVCVPPAYLCNRNVHSSCATESLANLPSGKAGDWCGSVYLLRLHGMGCWQRTMDDMVCVSLEERCACCKACQPEARVHAAVCASSEGNGAANMAAALGGMSCGGKRGCSIVLVVFLCMCVCVYAPLPAVLVCVCFSCECAAICRCVVYVQGQT